MREVQDQLRAKKVLIPVAVSSDGRMGFPEPAMSVSDVVLIHGNNRTPEQKQKRADELRGVQKPVLMNEDDNGRETTDANLEREIASCGIFFKDAGGWGYMPWVQAQRFPFRYSGGDDRDMRYFHSVLDHIAGLTRKQPPHGK
jgi:hypothetical protein